MQMLDCTLKQLTSVFFPTYYSVILPQPTWHCTAYALRQHQ